MSAISRLHVPSSNTTTLLLRILERPGLVAAVRQLPGAALGKLIERIGLEDAGELVALATTQQLERVFDDDLWRADRAGGDETFRPERFALWLRVMLEAGDDALVQRLCELPRDLVALAVHRLVLVLDMDVLEEMLKPGDEEAEALEQALENAALEEWEEFRLIAREPDAWDDVWNALVLLDRDHHDRLRAILETCCEMSTEYISGQGGLYQVLTASEMLEGDVAAARDDRRSAEGFVSPADARAFLELARRGQGGDERDPITRAYFRALQLQHAEVSAPAMAPPLAALAAASAGTKRAAPESKADRGHMVARLFEHAMQDLRQRDPALFSARVREVGYLVNVWIAGGAQEGRRPRPAEALETVLATCEAALQAQPEQALELLVQTPADVLFRRGLRAARGQQKR